LVILWDKTETRLEREEVSQCKKTSKEEVSITINNLLEVIVSKEIKLNLVLEQTKVLITK
jgi:hypothetical protein